MKEKTKEFCCNTMNKAVNEEYIVAYDEFFRNYDVRIPFKKQLRILYFCPWCGNKLPKTLNEEYFNILKEEHGIEVPDLTNFTNVPKEFQSDEWWKKRGL